MNGQAGKDDTILIICLTNLLHLVYNTLRLALARIAGVKFSIPNFPTIGRRPRDVWRSEDWRK
jgi:hypothetical protein